MTTVKVVTNKNYNIHNAVKAKKSFLYTNNVYL